MDIEQAEILARGTDYAIEVEQTNYELGADPINWGDASAFFLEGYKYAMNER